MEASCYHEPWLTFSNRITSRKCSKKKKIAPQCQEDSFRKTGRWIRYDRMDWKWFCDLILSDVVDGYQDMPEIRRVDSCKLAGILKSQEVLRW